MSGLVRAGILAYLDAELPEELVGRGVVVLRREGENPPRLLRVRVWG